MRSNVIKNVVKYLIYYYNKEQYTTLLSASLLYCFHTETISDFLKNNVIVFTGDNKYYLSINNYIITV